MLRFFENGWADTRTIDGSVFLSCLLLVAQVRHMSLMAWIIGKPRGLTQARQLEWLNWLQMLRSADNLEDPGFSCVSDILNGL